MTDYFALLGQPRRAWLDPEELKRAFHEKTRQAHPDAREAGTRGTDAEFAAINEAWRILQRSEAPTASSAQPGGARAGRGGRPTAAGDRGNVRRVADATQGAGRVVQEAAATTNPLSRSLVQTKIVIAGRRVSDALDRLRQMLGEAESELRSLNEGMDAASEDWLARCERLYFRFAYLTRWIAQLEEKQTQLATC